MKKSAQLIVSFCFAALTFGCGGSSHNSEPATFALNTDAVFRVGETRRIENTSTTIKLDAVTNDSRCPQNFACFSAGTLDTRILVSDSTSKNAPFTVPLALTGADLPSTSARPAYKITINPNNVQPNFGPNSTNLPTFPQKDYAITFRVTLL